MRVQHPIDPNTIRGLLNQLLFEIDRVPELNDEAATKLAASIVEQKYFRHSPQEYVVAIATAVQDGRLPEQVAQNSRRYTEAQLIEFLQRVAKLVERHDV